MADSPRSSNQPQKAATTSSATAGTRSSQAKAKTQNTPAGRARPQASVGNSSRTPVSQSQRNTTTPRASNIRQQNNTNGETALSSRARTSAVARAPGGSATTATTRKQPNAQPEVEDWKAKYEQQLTETKRLEQEKKQAETAYADLVTEYSRRSEDTGTGKQDCETAQNEAAEYATQLTQAQADVETQRQEILELKNSKDKLSMELIYYRGEFDKAQSQAKLAGDLPTQVNVVNHVHSPKLQQKNEELRQRVSDLQVDLAAAEQYHQKTTAYMNERNGELDEGNDINKASKALFQESQAYIMQLEKTNEKTNSLYIDAVQEMDQQRAEIDQQKAEIDQRKAEIAAVKNKIEDDKRRFQEILVRNKQLTRELQDLQSEVESLKQEALSAPDEFELYSNSSATSKFSDVAVAAVETDFVSPRKPPSTFSGIFTGIESERSAPPKLSVAQITTVSFGPSPETPPASSPPPPLDQDLQITINVEPKARAKLALLRRLTTITTKSTSFKINGPEKITDALVIGMKDAQAEVDLNKIKIQELQTTLWRNIQEIEDLKRNPCTIAAHKTLADDLAAMKAQHDIQVLMLMEYSSKLQNLQKRPSVQ